MEIYPLNRRDMLNLQSLRTATNMDGSLGNQEERQRSLTLEQIEQHLQSPFVTFGAYNEASLIGAASVSLMQKNLLEPDGLTWYGLSCVLVAVQERGKGIGRKLVEKSLEYAIEHGADGVLLIVNTPNIAAKLLYESLGFEVWNVNENTYNYNGISFSEVSMRKRFKQT